jgi:branched-chain amino acid transport system ATP-binding protein
VLVAEGIRKQFAGVQALAGVDLAVQAGESVGLIGPNGSGKSTLLNVLSGFERADRGRVTFADTRVERSAPHRIARLGMRRTFQLASQPQRMTVMEVLLAGARLPLGAAARASLLRPRAVAAEQRVAEARAWELLEELTLTRLAHAGAGTLSGGQQKLLALGAVLMGEPRLLLLDEPMAGVNAALRSSLLARLLELRARGTTLLVVEHDVAFVGELCERVVVLDEGEVVVSCAPGELADHPRVVEAYLGSARVPAGQVAS